MLDETRNEKIQSTKMNKSKLSLLACALILGGCAGQQAARDRLGIEDPTVLQSGVGTVQSVAAGAPTTEWVNTYSLIGNHAGTFAKLQLQLDASGDDKRSYFHAKAQCWLDVGQQEWKAHDQWGFVEEAVGQAAVIVGGLENGTTLSAANPELRTVSTVRPDLWDIVNVIKADPDTARCPQAQQPLACAEVELMQAGHYAWIRNFSAAENMLPGIQNSLQKSAQIVLQCASQKAPTSTPNVAQKITLRADSSFRFDGGDEAAMLPRGKAQLDEVVTGLQKATNIRGLNVTGYTDRLGSDVYNQKLSLQRAQTVQSYLRSRGVTLPMSAQGRGKAKPLVDCKQKRHDQLVGCLAPNRRVEIEFLRGDE
jgi:OOP family OmpA-OmpF porin